METSVFKRALRVALALFMALYFAPGLIASPQKAYADATTSTNNTARVNDLTGLQSAIGNSSVGTIVVSKTISLTGSASIDGDGKTIQVAAPYADASGACASGATSGYSVFDISPGATVTLKNMTIYGGGTSDTAGGIVLGDSAILNADNVTIARSHRGLSIGSNAKASLANCNIVRNVCGYGAGVLCDGGTLVMNNCSLSENRSTSQGGGAIEIKSSGKFYANNTVIANNCSAEIGGAVNNYESNVYLMNCAVTGNVTTSAANAGGGIGNNAGSFYAVNSIFLDNKYISGGNSTPVASDIGLYSSSSSGSVKLFHCVYGAICNGSSSSVSSIVDDTCKQLSDSDSNSVFAAHRGDGVLCKESGSTTGFTHPALVSKSGTYALYAPLKSGDSNPAASNGIATYFDKSDLNAVKMSYGEGGSTTLGSLNTASTKVNTYFEGGRRADNIIGASGAGEVSMQYRTVKLEESPKNGSVSDITLHGDSKVEGSTVSFEATPDYGYAIGTVTIAKTGEPSTTITPTVSGNMCSFTMPNYDVTVSVSFTNVTHKVTLSAAPENGTVTGIDTTGADKGVGTTVSFNVNAAEGYKVAPVTAAKTDNAGADITVNGPDANGNYSFTMPDCDVIVTVSFKPLPVTPPTPPAPPTTPTTPPISTPSAPSVDPDPAPSGITTSGATDVNGNDGSIVGVTSQMEYKLEGASEWTSVPDGMTELKGLAPGSYLVRYRGASTYTKVTVASASLYKIDVKAKKGGEASANKKAAAKGELITLSAKTAKSYNLRGWIIDGKLIEENTFIMPAADVSVEPVFSPVAQLFTAKAKAYKTKAKLSWKAYPGAAEYKVYVAKPGMKLKKATVLSGDELSYSAKKLKAGKVYCLRVVAVDENGSKLVSSPIVYITPKGGKYANASKLSVASASIALEVGQKAKLGAKVAAKDAKSKRLLAGKGVAKLRYVSSEPAIVKINKKGKVTALHSGTAYVYAIAADGVAKRVKVVVAQRCGRA